MNRLKLYAKQFHPVVWVLLGGTVLARGASFMTLPFLAIYLSSTMDLHPLLIGLTIGISPLTGTIGGFIGGYLSDRFGRKPVMLSALMMWCLVFYGFALADSPALFVILNALNGLCSSFFEPTSQALIADLTDKKYRMKAFSLRYTAINVGASAGPLLGAYLAAVSADSTFVITGTIYLLYGIFLAVFLARYKIKKTADPAKKGATFKESLRVVRRDKALLFLILGSILINFGYAQIDSTLPQFLENELANGIVVYSSLLSINAVMVVILQLPISSFAEKFQPLQVMMCGSVLLSLGLVCFSFTNGWIIGILAMLIVTIGEILIFPSSSIMIDQLADDTNRGTYFGASQFRKIGHFAGPILGGFLLGQTGGQIAFWIIAGLSLGSIVFYRMGNLVTVKAGVRSVEG
ncbi:MFS transporter [Bacillus infantis]|uniref:MDR family MFS transporter n=1 Tax=Bacillus infantis TaxID=324767 RepID=UPI001CD1960B|nr:MFS transporter [Bacillus infantis]MCA1035619.1 MFS transporter [Bacillus infantis]